MSHVVCRESLRAHYATKAQLTKAYIGLQEPNRLGSDLLRSVSLVLPELFIAGRDAEADAMLLQSLGISHVLQAGIELTPSHPGSFTYLQLPMYDLEEQDLLTHLRACVSFIEGASQKGGKVLVHCAAGVSRSASVVIAYVMRQRHVSFDAARTIVKRARPAVNPNLGFALQLRMLDQPGAWEALMHGDVEVWPPTWDLERFLDMREACGPEGADDRTMQGAVVATTASLSIDNDGLSLGGSCRVSGDGNNNNVGIWENKQGLTDPDVSTVLGPGWSEALFQAAAGPAWFSQPQYSAAEGSHRPNQLEVPATHLSPHDGTALPPSPSLTGHSHQVEGQSTSWSSSYHQAEGQCTSRSSSYPFSSINQHVDLAIRSRSFSSSIQPLPPNKDSLRSPRGRLRSGHASAAVQPDASAAVQPAVYNKDPGSSMHQTFEPIASPAAVVLGGKVLALSSALLDDPQRPSAAASGAPSETRSGASADPWWASAFGPPGGQGNPLASVMPLPDDVIGPRPSALPPNQYLYAPTSLLPHSLLSGASRRRPAPYSKTMGQHPAERAPAALPLSPPVTPPHAPISDGLGAQEPSTTYNGRSSRKSGRPRKSAGLQRPASPGDNSQHPLRPQIMLQYALALQQAASGLPPSGSSSDLHDEEASSPNTPAVAPLQVPSDSGVMIRKGLERDALLQHQRLSAPWLSGISSSEGHAALSTSDDTPQQREANEPAVPILRESSMLRDESSDDDDDIVKESGGIGLYSVLGEGEMSSISLWGPQSSRLPTAYDDLPARPSTYDDQEECGNPSEYGSRSRWIERRQSQGSFTGPSLSRDGSGTGSFLNLREESSSRSGVRLPRLPVNKVSNSGSAVSLMSRPSTAQSILSNASFGSHLSLSSATLALASERGAGAGNTSGILSRSESISSNVSFTLGGSVLSPVRSLRSMTAMSGSGNGRGGSVPVIPLVLPRIVSGRVSQQQPDSSINMPI